MKIADKIIWKKFHTEYKVLDKYAYILKVIDSCETEAQLRCATGWGLKVLNHLYNKIIYSLRYFEGSLSLNLDVRHGLLMRFNEMEDEIVNHFSELLKETKES